MSEARVERTTAAATPGEDELLARLRAGDERAFETLVERYHGMMLGVARTYVKTRAVAEEVVQEAWLGVLKGLDGFEGRSSLKTWVLRILVNTAMTRGGREARTVPFSSLAEREEDAPAVGPDRFRDSDDAFPGHWLGYPSNWQELPYDRLLGRETIDTVKEAIEHLPDAQRTVIVLRDVQGCSSEDVCEMLDVSEGNQRVLLHRARSRVRAALERHLDD